MRFLDLLYILRRCMIQLAAVQCVEWKQSDSNNKTLKTLDGEQSVYSLSVNNVTSN